MDHHDTISAELPSPWDDEPATLRQDIIDELADHLACAYNRELLSGRDPDQARERAFDRFGDPAAVARRLWLDAMRGKIMAQRVVMVTCLVVTLASLSLAGLLWRQTIQIQRDSARAAAETRLALTLQNERAESGQQEMLKQLREISEGIKNPRSLEWNSLTFQLVEESPGRPAATGFVVSLIRQGEEHRRSLDRTSDSSGLVDFGVVQPGDYEYQLNKGWKDGVLRTSGRLTILPGSQVHRQVICPKVPTERVAVRVRCNWPADLEQKGLIVYAPFAFRYRRLHPGLDWSLSQLWSPQLPALGRNSVNISIPPAQLFNTTRSILCGPGAAMVEILNLAGPCLWSLKPGEAGWADFLTEDLRAIKEAPDEAAAVHWEPGTYKLSELIILRPTPPGAIEVGRKRFEILVETRPAGFGHARYTLEWSDQPDRREQHPHEGLLRTPYSMMAGNAYRNQGSPLTNLELPEEYWGTVTNHFEARSGTVNEWAIALPDELVKAVRDRLQHEN
jgi:hypothetical protein